MKGNPLRPMVLLLALTVTLSTGLHAQERVEPFLAGGIALGTGDLGQDTGTGWSLYGGVNIAVGVPGLSVGPTVTYARIPYDGGFNEAEGITALFVEAEYLPMARSAGSVAPFLRAGAGLHVHRYDPGDIDTRASTLSRAGLTAGAGIRLDLGGVSALLGGRYLGDLDRGFLGFFGGVSFPL